MGRRHRDGLRRIGSGRWRGDVRSETGRSEMINDQSKITDSRDWLRAFGGEHRMMGRRNGTDWRPILPCSGSQPSALSKGSIRGRRPSWWLMTAPRVARTGPRIGLRARVRASPGPGKPAVGSPPASGPRASPRAAGRAGSRAEHAAGRQAERHRAPRRVDHRPAVHARLQGRHEAQFPQQASSNRSTRRARKRRVAQMPQGHDRRVEEPRVGVVVVGQLVQQLGDVVAGVQSRQIAAKGVEAFDEHAPRSGGRATRTPCEAARYRKRSAGQGRTGTAT